jgi:two-component system sensor histidine kinase MprB
VNTRQSEHVLGELAREIAAFGVAVTLAAAAAGPLLARGITRRSVRLTGIAEGVATTGLGERTSPVDGGDEVTRRSSASNTMLRRLATAGDAQERLVQGTAHELRTPLTGLRTNAILLHRLDPPNPESRERMVADIDGETRELARLVGELVELALARRFRRFYRAATRALPGSGLGLAIVLDVAESHDGAAFAGNRPGGGTEIGCTVGSSRVVPDLPAGLQ